MLKPTIWLMRVLLPELGTPRMLTRNRRDPSGEIVPEQQISIRDEAFLLK